MEKSLKTATASVLIGMTFAWVGFMVATYLTVTLIKNVTYSNISQGGVGSSAMSVATPSTYVYLFALLGQAFFVARAYRLSDVALANNTPGTLPVLRYASLWLVITALSLFFFAFSAFVTSLGGSFLNIGFVDLTIGVYLPILLGALGSLAMLLSTTVYRKSEMGQTERTAEEKKSKLEASLSFIFPVLGIALVFILSSMGANFGAGTSVWFWIFILLMVAASLGFGGFYAARTKSLAFSQAEGKGTKTTTALKVNLVLAVIFIVILTGVSFGAGQGVVGAYTTGTIPTGDWVVNYMLPVVAVYVITVVITYFTVRVRSIISAK